MRHEITGTIQRLEHIESVLELFHADKHAAILKVLSQPAAKGAVIYSNLNTRSTFFGHRSLVAYGDPPLTTRTRAEACGQTLKSKSDEPEFEFPTYWWERR